MRSPPRRSRGCGSSTTRWAPPPRRRSTRGCPPRWRRSSPATAGRRLLALRAGAAGEGCCRRAAGSPTTRGSSSCAGPSPRRSASTDLDRPRPRRARRPGARRAARRACSACRRASPTGSRRCPGRPGWHCFGVEDEGALVAAAVLHSSRRRRLAGFGATDPGAPRPRAPQGAVRGAHRAGARARAATGSWWRRASRRRAGRIRRIATSSPPASGPVYRRPFWRGPERPVRTGGRGKAGVARRAGRR